MSPPGSTSAELVRALEGEGGDGRDDLRAARAFLAGGAAAGLAGAIGAEVQDALVELLIGRGDAGRLETLASVADKGLAKRARRGIHLLRTRGVKAEVPRRAEPDREAKAPEATSELPSLLSAPIRDGEYFVWYARPAGAGEQGLDVCYGEINESDGLVRFDRLHPSRRQWREVERSLASGTGLALAHVPPAWARWLLEEAYRRAIDAGRTPPREFAEIRYQLEPPERPERHPATLAVPEERVAQAGPPEAAIALPETANWIPDEQAARKAYEEIQSLSQSALIVDERTRKEQLDETLRRICGEALRGPWRARLERRLLDTAYFIARLADAHGQAAPGRDHFADAALCIAAARHVADESVPAEDNRVARALFARLAPAPTEAEPPPRESGGLIVPP